MYISSMPNLSGATMKLVVFIGILVAVECMPRPKPDFGVGSVPTDINSQDSVQPDADVSKDGEVTVSKTETKYREDQSSKTDQQADEFNHEDGRGHSVSGSSEKNSTSSQSVKEKETKKQSFSVGPSGGIKTAEDIESDKEKNTKNTESGRESFQEKSGEGTDHSRTYNSGSSYSNSSETHDKVKKKQHKEYSLGPDLQSKSKNSESVTEEHDKKDSAKGSDFQNEETYDRDGNTVRRSRGESQNNFQNENEESSRLESNSSQTSEGNNNGGTNNQHGGNGGVENGKAGNSDGSGSDGNDGAGGNGGINGNVNGGSGGSDGTDVGTRVSGGTDGNVNGGSGGNGGTNGELGDTNFGTSGDGDTKGQNGDGQSGLGLNNFGINSGNNQDGGQNSGSNGGANGNINTQGGGQTSVDSNGGTDSGDGSNISVDENRQGNDDSEQEVANSGTVLNGGSDIEANQGGSSGSNQGANSEGNSGPDQGANTGSDDGVNLGIDEGTGQGADANSGLNQEREGNAAVNQAGGGNSAAELSSGAIANSETGVDTGAGGNTGAGVNSGADVNSKANAGSALGIGGGSSAKENAGHQHHKLRFRKHILKLLDEEEKNLGLAKYNQYSKEESSEETNKAVDFDKFRKEYLLSVAQNIHNSKIITDKHGRPRVVYPHHNSDETEYMFSGFMGKSPHHKYAHKYGQSPISSHYANVKYIEDRFGDLPSLFGSKKIKLRTSIGNIDKNNGTDKNLGRSENNYSIFDKNGLSLFDKDMFDRAKAKYEGISAVDLQLSPKQWIDRFKKEAEHKHHRFGQKQASKSEGRAIRLDTIDPIVRDAILSRNLADILKTAKTPEEIKIAMTTIYDDRATSIPSQNNLDKKEQRLISKSNAKHTILNINNTNSFASNTNDIFNHFIGQKPNLDIAKTSYEEAKELIKQVKPEEFDFTRDIFGARVTPEQVLENSNTGYASYGSYNSDDKVKGGVTYRFDSFGVTTDKVFIVKNPELESLRYVSDTENEYNNSYIVSKYSGFDSNANSRMNTKIFGNKYNGSQDLNNIPINKENNYEESTDQAGLNYRFDGTTAKAYDSNFETITTRQNITSEFDVNDNIKEDHKSYNTQKDLNNVTATNNSIEVKTEFDTVIQKPLSLSNQTKNVDEEYKQSKIINEASKIYYDVLNTEEVHESYKNTESSDNKSTTDSSQENTQSYGQQSMNVTTDDNIMKNSNSVLETRTFVQNPTETEFVDLNKRDSREFVNFNDAEVVYNNNLKVTEPKNKFDDFPNNTMLTDKSNFTSVLSNKIFDNVDRNSNKDLSLDASTPMQKPATNETSLILNNESTVKNTTQTSINASESTSFDNTREMTSAERLFARSAVGVDVDADYNDNATQIHNIHNNAASYTFAPEMLSDETYVLNNTPNTVSTTLDNVSTTSNNELSLNANISENFDDSAATKSPDVSDTTAIGSKLEVSTERNQKTEIENGTKNVTETSTKGNSNRNIELENIDNTNMLADSDKTEVNNRKLTEVTYPANKTEDLDYSNKQSVKRGLLLDKDSPKSEETEGGGFDYSYTSGPNATYTVVVDTEDQSTTSWMGDRYKIRELVNMTKPENSTHEDSTTAIFEKPVGTISEIVATNPSYISSENQTVAFNERNQESMTEQNIDFKTDILGENRSEVTLSNFDKNTKNTLANFTGVRTEINIGVTFENTLNTTETSLIIPYENFTKATISKNTDLTTEKSKDSTVETGTEVSTGTTRQVVSEKSLTTTDSEIYIEITPEKPLQALSETTVVISSDKSLLATTEETSFEKPIEVNMTNEEVSIENNMEPTTDASITTEISKWSRSEVTLTPTIYKDTEFTSQISRDSNAQKHFPENAIVPTYEETIETSNETTTIVTTETSVESTVERNTEITNKNVEQTNAVRNAEETAAIVRQDRAKETINATPEKQIEVTTDISKQTQGISSENPTTSSEKSERSAEVITDTTKVGKSDEINISTSDKYLEILQAKETLLENTTTTMFVKPIETLTTGKIIEDITEISKINSANNTEIPPEKTKNISIEETTLASSAQNVTDGIERASRSIFGKDTEENLFKTDESETNSEKELPVTTELVKETQVITTSTEKAKTTVKSQAVSTEKPKTVKLKTSTKKTTTTSKPKITTKKSNKPVKPKKPSKSAKSDKFLEALKSDRVKEESVNEIEEESISNSDDSTSSSSSEGYIHTSNLESLDYSEEKR